MWARKVTHIPEIVIASFRIQVEMQRYVVIHAYIWVQFVVENGHKKDMCCNESGLWAQQYVDTILGSTVVQRWTQLGGPMQPLKEKDNLHFHGIWTSILKLEMTSYMDLNCWLDATIRDLTPTVNIICGVGIAHYRARYLILSPNIEVMRYWDWDWDWGWGWGWSSLGL